MTNLTRSEQIEAAKNLLPGYERYKRFHDEMEVYFRQRFGVIMINHKGDWYWQVVGSDERVMIEDHTFGGMLEWCLENRGGYESTTE